MTRGELSSLLAGVFLVGFPVSLTGASVSWVGSAIFLGGLVGWLVYLMISDPRL